MLYWFEARTFGMSAFRQSRTEDKPSADNFRRLTKVCHLTGKYKHGSSPFTKEKRHKHYLTHLA